MTSLLPSALSAFPNNLLATIFNPTPTPHDLLVLVSSIALFWWVIFYLLHLTLHPFAQRQSWLRSAFGREYDRVGLAMCKALNVEWTKDRFIDIMMNDWPKMQGIYLQHFIGGALCLPAVFGLCDDSTSSSLACLGVLSEMGWELSDMADIFITRTTLPDGRERIPNNMLAIWMVHHSMTLTLGLPMVLKYRELRELHLLTFNLQWAAAIAIGVNEITKCLDLKSTKELWAFRIMNGLCFIIMAWMRGVCWVYLSAKVILIWYNDEEWTILLFGTVVCILISGFNFGLCIFPFYKKMIKFGGFSTCVCAEKAQAMDENEKLVVVSKDDESER
ncbi:hypothetical protein ACHAWX_007188 [Stephanocyclus meneghinianus]